MQSTKWTDDKDNYDDGDVKCFIFIVWQVDYYYYAPCAQFTSRRVYNKRSNR